MELYSWLNRDRCQDIHTVVVLLGRSTVICENYERNTLDVEALRSQVEAMGGQLEIVARFPDGVVNTFSLAGYSGRRCLSLHSTAS